MQKSNYILSPCVLIVLPLHFMLTGWLASDQQQHALQPHDMHRTRMRRLTRSIIHSNPNVCAGCSSSLLNKRACNGRVTGLLYSPISCVNHIILFQIYKCELVFWFSANEHHTLISKCRAKQKVQERCQSTSKLTTPLLYVSSSLPIKSHML